MKFDLEQFKNGRPAITRDGEKAYFLAYDENLSECNQLVVRVDSDLLGFNVNGRYYEGVEDNYDLIDMATEVREGWINVYPRGSCYSEVLRATKDDAITCAGPECLGQVRVTYEVPEKEGGEA